MRWLIVALVVACVGAESKLPALHKLAEAEVANVVWLAASAGGRELAVCSGSDAQIRDATTLKLTRTHRVAGRRVEFVLDDKFLVVAGVRQTGIELLDRKSGDTVQLSKGEPDFLTLAGRNLLGYRNDGDDGLSLEVYDLAKRKVIRRWEPGAWIGSPGLRAFSSKGVLLGDCIHTKKRDGKTTLVDSLVLWKPPFDRDPALIECSGESKAVALAADGKCAALGNETNVDIWDLDKVKKLQTLTVPHADARVVVLAYAPDGTRLAVLSSRNADRRRTRSDTGEQVVTVYDTTTWKPLASSEVHRSPGYLLAFFADGKRLATAGRFDGCVRLWQVK